MLVLWTGVEREREKGGGRQRERQVYTHSYTPSSPDPATTRSPIAPDRPAVLRGLKKAGG